MSEVKSINKEEDIEEDSLSAENAQEQHLKSPAISPVPVTKFRDGDGNSGLLDGTPSCSNLGHDCKGRAMLLLARPRKVRWNSNNI